MKKPISVKTKQILTTGLLGLSTLYIGLHNLLDGGLVSVIIEVILSLAALSSIIGIRYIKSEPWDEMCQQNWNEASNITLGLIVCGFLIYGMALSEIKVEFLHNPGFPILLAGIAMLMRLVFFFKFEKEFSDLEEE